MTKPTCEQLLRLVDSASPNPWYPRVYADGKTELRESLDEPLTELRMSGLVKLTDWEKQTGQGLVLTEHGREVLANPVIMEKLKDRFDSQVIRLKAPEPETDIAGLPVETTFERGEAARAAFLRPTKSVATKWIIAVNLLAFLISVAWCVRHDVPLSKFLASGDPEAIRRLGGLSASALLNEHWSVLVTSAFLHFGVLHLGMNMLVLYALGPIIESAWGSSRFVVIYLLSALGGSTFCMVFDPGTPERQPVTAGASGAMFGIMASWIVWTVWNRSHLPQAILRAWAREKAWMLVVWIAISFVPGISFYGHLGGAVFGAVAGILLFLQWHYSQGFKAFAFGTLAVLPILCVALIMNAMRNGGEWKSIKEARATVEARSEINRLSSSLPSSRRSG